MRGSRYRKLLRRVRRLRRRNVWAEAWWNAFYRSFRQEKQRTGKVDSSETAIEGAIKKSIRQHPAPRLIYPVWYDTLLTYPGGLRGDPWSLRWYKYAWVGLRESLAGLPPLEQLIYAPRPEVAHIGLLAYTQHQRQVAQRKRTGLLRGRQQVVLHSRWVEISRMWPTLRMNSSAPSYSNWKTL